MTHFLGNMPLEETITLLKRDTRRYAKRQFTWFRREPESCWVDITGIDQPEEIAERIKKNIEISNDLV
jgi:tRNA dimethylallyltransferase